MSKLYPKLQIGGIVPNKSQKTKLTQGQQLAYEKWKSENKYNESDDYDLAGYWKEQGMKNLSFPNLSPIEKFKEIESKDFPQLDDFYKNNKNTAGMYHGEGTISRNLYSDRSPRALNKVMELEKMRGVLEENRNDPNLPKLNFKIRREDNNAFKTNKQYSIRENPESKNAIHYIDTNKKTRRETIASRVYIGDALLNQDTNSYVEPSNEQVIQTKRLSDYAHSKPYHLPDKFKRLAPFSNGDGYMLLSEESKYSGNPSYNLSDKNGNPLNTSFDKRGQGFWQGNQFIGYQSGGTLSQLGYKKHSPYNKAPSLLIHTPTGSITMKEVDHPILGIGKGEIKFMLPNKEYQFKSSKVLEIPMKSIYPKKYQQGGQAPEMSPEQQQEIVRRVRNLRKTIGYNKVGSVPLDGIQFRHYMYVNKKKLQKEDEELLGAFDEEQMVKLMNEVPDENEIPMGQTGMQMPTSPHNRIIKDADKQIMLNVIKSAHKNRVDPYTAVSIGLQETGLLKSVKWSRNGLNPLHDNSTIPDEGSLDRSMLFLKKKFDYAKQLGKTDEASQIQAWNGYGKMRPGVNQKSLTTWALNNEDAFDKAMSLDKLDSLENAHRKPRDKMYGISFTKDNPLDFNKNPVYGKRILDIRENFVKKDIPTVNMINSIIGLGNSPGQYVLTKPNQTSVKLFKLGGKTGSKSKMYPKCKCGCGGVSVKGGMKFQQGGTMDVLDEDGNSQMKIVGGERIFSRVATSKMLMLNEGGKMFELGKFVCDELSAQEKRKPQYVKE